ncbi:MAG: long-chain fatty acid--CoA ligase, partial [Bacteroidetes bacterium]|nr:long-chain fatty acid--CoA ligase [Bacteroidota bacterium]
MNALVDFNTIPQLFNRLVDYHVGKDQTVLRYVDKDSKEWVDVKWTEFRDRARAMAGYLYAQGVRPGDRVAILSENRPEWAYADMATQLLGAVNVSLYTTLPPKEVSYIIHDSGASVFVVSTGIQLKKALEIYDVCPDLKRIVSMVEGRDELPDYVDLFDDAIESGYGLYTEFEDAIRANEKSVTPEDLAVLIYTSGTTGNPKGVMLSHANLCENLKSALTRLRLREGGRHLSFLPLCHSFERLGGYLGTLASGMTISYARSIDTVTSDILEVKPTVLLSVPRLYEKIFNAVSKSVEEGGAAKKKIFAWAQDVGFRHNLKKARSERIGPILSAQYKLAFKLVFAKLHEKLGGHIEFGVSGGAALPKSIGEFFFSAGIPIVEGYGLTETSPVLSISPFDDPQYGKVGHIIPGVTVAIQNPDTLEILGEQVGDNYPSALTTTSGEIIAKGPNIMKGYWGNPEATAEAIDKDGWYHTGDVGRFENGFLVITDRIKHMLVSAGGKNIYPGPIEEGFKHEPWIDQIMIVGEAREFLTALVVPDEGVIRSYAKEQGLAASSLADILATEEVQRVFQQLFRSYSRSAAAHEKVRDFRLVLEPFSVDNGMMTPTMKLKRKVIGERYADLIEEMYAGVIGR